LELPRVAGGLEGGVLQEGGAGLIDGDEVRMVGEVAEQEVGAAEHLAEFADLAGVGGGDEEAAQSVAPERPELAVTRLRRRGRLGRVAPDLGRSGRLERAGGQRLVRGSARACSRERRVAAQQ